MSETNIHTTCCIVGGGPAGLMLGTMLARAGVDVTVLEKHADFLRDFRGDTIHPSTLAAMDDLGLIDELLTLPHQKASRLHATINGETIRIAYFTRLKTRHPFVAFMPQWDLLDFLARKARAFPNFRLLMRTEAKDIVFDNGIVAGVAAQTPDGPLIVHAPLVVACDGRDSHMRAKGGFTPQALGAPMDVLWFKLSRRESDGDELMGRFDAGRIFIGINRGTVWQCGYVIAKDSYAGLKSGPLDPLRTNIAAVAPLFADRVSELTSWDDVKLLTVTVDRLPLWHRPGLLCIGDAAHAMSPIGGIGINLAIQDAIAAANLLVRKLRDDGRIDDADLAAVQRRREWPTRVTQRIQVTIQNNIIAPALQARERTRAPWLLRHLQDIPLLRDLPARFVGLGVRPEHPDMRLFERR